MKSSGLIFVSAMFFSTLVFAIRGGELAEDSRLLSDHPQNWENGIVQIYSLHPNSEKYVCTGSIVGTHLVLTSAHCFDTGHSQWKIKHNNGQFDVASIGIHKEYQREEVFDAYWNFLLEIRLHNDLALIKTQQPFPSTKDLSLSANVSVDAKSENELFLVGFGQTEHLFGIGEGEGHLRIAGPLNYNGHYEKRIHLANRPVGGCLGDSGGPLLSVIKQQIVIVGVLSQSDCMGTTTYQAVTPKLISDHQYSWEPLTKRVAIIVKE